jgi:hypothetical protein
MHPPLLNNTRLLLIALPTAQAAGHIYAAGRAYDYIMMHVELAS